MTRRLVDVLVRAAYVAVLLGLLSVRLAAQRAPVDARVRAQIDLDLEHEMRVPHSGAHDSAPVLFPMPFYHDSVMLNRERSRAVAGLTYTWGVYRPAKTADILLTTLAGDAKERIVTLATPDDWWKLASVLSWEPRGDDDAVAACGELISYVGPRRSVSIRPLPYLGTKTLNRVDNVMRQHLKNSELRPPLVTRVAEGSRYRVALWAIEGARIARYRCEIGSSPPTLVVTDSVDGAGFFPYGPN